ncbi:MAG: PD-(D/E)XK nuclease family protein [Planctomycetes bacterium]|nr:PD-(D/E)XK nuclease family protein [Planctomycetota bacterium]
MAEEELSPDEALKALERFVVENNDLLALEERIGRFNIFDALGVARAEIRHSNFLAWLLDPAESHGQGALFLKAILMDLLAQTPPELRPLSPVELDGVELRGVDIRREWRNIDILITCEDPPFVVAIENKIDAAEHGKQLSRYEEAVKQGFGSLPKQFVYLTIDGDEPSEEKWVPYSYADIHRVLSPVRNTSATAIGEDVLAFLDHYLRLIGSRFMDDPKIDDLCQRIYRNHRAAIDLVFDRAKTPHVRIMSVVRGVLQERHDYCYIANRYSAKERSVDFVPSQWLKLLPDIGTWSPKDRKPVWLTLGFTAETDHLCFWAGAWMTINKKLCHKVIERLTRDKQEFGFYGSKGKGSYGALGRATVVEWDEEEGPDEDEIAAAVRGKLDELEHRLAGVPEALRPILQEHATPAGSP